MKRIIINSFFTLIFYYLAFTNPWSIVGAIFAVFSGHATYNTFDSIRNYKILKRGRDEN